MRLVLLQLPIILIKYFTDPVSHQPPGFLPVRNKIIEGILQENIICKGNVVKIAQLVQSPKVYSGIPNSRTDGDHIVPGQKYAKRDILYRKI